jgi:hypothetical protein
VPATSDSALRLGLAVLGQVVTALVAAVETPPGDGPRIFDMPDTAKAQLPT